MADFTGHMCNQNLVCQGVKMQYKPLKATEMYKIKPIFWTQDQKVIKDLRRQICISVLYKIGANCQKNPLYHVSWENKGVI